MAFTWAQRRCGSTAAAENLHGLGNPSSIMVRNGASIMHRDGGAGTTG